MGKKGKKGKEKKKRERVAVFVIPYLIISFVERGRKEKRRGGEGRGENSRDVELETWSPVLIEIAKKGVRKPVPFAVRPPSEKEKKKKKKKKRKRERERANPILGGAGNQGVCSFSSQVQGKGERETVTPKKKGRGGGRK